MIGGLARMGKWFIDSGMRRGTPKADHENVITVYGGTDPWKQRVGFRDPKAAYLILIGPNGKVVWRYAGSLDEEPYQALSSEVSRLLSCELSTMAVYTLHRELVGSASPCSTVFDFFSARRIWNESRRHGCGSGFSLRRPSR